MSMTLFLGKQTIETDYGDNGRHNANTRHVITLSKDDKTTRIIGVQERVNYTFAVLDTHAWFNNEKRICDNFPINAKHKYMKTQQIEQ